MTIISPLSAQFNRPRGRVIRMAWTTKTPPSHEFLAIACPEEEDGGFSVFALNYPGVISQGETLEEARSNIAEAFLAVLEARRKRGEEMQFSYNPVVEITENCSRFRVTVDA
jgi:predicted RNase H-like HicB family nuclease